MIVAEMGLGGDLKSGGRRGSLRVEWGLRKEEEKRGVRVLAVTEIMVVGMRAEEAVGRMQALALSDFTQFVFAIWGTEGNTEEAADLNVNGFTNLLAKEPIVGWLQPGLNGLGQWYAFSYRREDFHIIQSFYRNKCWVGDHVSFKSSKLPFALFLVGPRVLIFLEEQNGKNKRKAAGERRKQLE